MFDKKKTYLVTCINRLGMPETEEMVVSKSGFDFMIRFMETQDNIKIIGKNRHGVIYTNA